MPPAHANSERRLGYILNDLSHLLRREFDRRVQQKKLGLTRAQWLILRQVSLQEGCLQRELAEGLRFAPATVGRHVERLAAAGWLDRRNDPRDARAYRLHLHPKAERTLARLKRLATQLRDEYFADIPLKRREALLDDLLVIKRNLLACRARAASRSFHHHANHQEFQAAR
jgi:DNA-binding MarR family transcriptional regulator